MTYWKHYDGSFFSCSSQGWFVCFSTSESHLLISRLLLESKPKLCPYSCDTHNPEVQNKEFKSIEDPSLICLEWGRNIFFYPSMWASWQWDRMELRRIHSASLAKADLAEVECVSIGLDNFLSSLSSR